MGTMVIDLSSETRRLTYDMHQLVHRLNLQGGQWFTSEFTEECIRALVTSRVGGKNPMHRLIEYTMAYDRVNHEIERQSVPLIYPFICNSLSAETKRKQICSIYFYGGAIVLRNAFPKVSGPEMQHLLSILEDGYRVALSGISDDIYERIYDALVDTPTISRLDRDISDFLEIHTKEKAKYIVRGGYLAITTTITHHPS